jgi:Cdc6-like AAA superfamily ATPase
MKTVTIEDEPTPANALNIHLGEHWGIVGKTGSGKTHFTLKGLLAYLQKQYPTVPRYVLDSTADPKISSLIPDALIVDGNEPPDLLRDAKQTQVWTPINSKIPDAYNRWFQRLNDARKPCIVVIDEIASITGKAEEGLEGLFKQLRKHGGTVIAETQEIAKVNTTYFRQLTHFVTFRINPETYDVTQARKYLDIPKEEYHQPRFKHGFHYRNTSEDTPVQEYQDMLGFFERDY